MHWIDTIIQGTLLGGLYALFAMGLAVIYGVMRQINIAHGDFIVLAAYVALGISATTGLHPFIVLPIAAVVFAASGYVLQRVVLNRTLGSDILPPLVVTYGLSIVVENALQQTTSADARSLKIGALETASFPLGGGLAVGWFPLIVFVTAVLVAIALEIVFNKTRLGMAFRAVSDDREIAQLMGVRDRRLYGYAAAISFAVIAIAGVFMGVKFTFTPTLGPSFLLYAFEAVVIGGLGSFWGTLAGGVILGIAQSIGFALNPGWGILAGHLVFLNRALVPPDRAVRADRMILARQVRVERWTRGSRLGASLAGLFTLFLATFPFWVSSDVMRLVVEFVCLLAIAQMWNLLAGYGGLVSIGQQAYIGIGGYSLFVLANGLGVNPFLCVLLGGIVAALLAVVNSRVLFGLSGGYFAVATWVVAEVYRLAVANVSALGGGSGESLTALIGIAKSTREAVTFWIAVALFVATTGGVYALLRSRLGLALTAIRDDAVAAESQGVDVARTKLIVYVVAAFGSGCAGALYFLNALRISPDAAFGADWIPLLFFTVVIGGIGTIEGPLVGTLLYFGLRQFFGDYGTWYLIALGLLAILIMIRFPRGIWGELARRFGWRLFPVQRILRE